MKFVPGKLYRAKTSNSRVKLETGDVVMYVRSVPKLSKNKAYPMGYAIEFLHRGKVFRYFSGLDPERDDIPVNHFEEVED